MTGRCRSAPRGDRRTGSPQHRRAGAIRRGCCARSCTSRSGRACCAARSPERFLELPDRVIVTVDAVATSATSRCSRRRGVPGRLPASSPTPSPTRRRRCVTGNERVRPRPSRRRGVLARAGPASAGSRALASGPRPHHASTPAPGRSPTRRRASRRSSPCSRTRSRAMRRRASTPSWRRGSPRPTRPRRWSASSPSSRATSAPSTHGAPGLPEPVAEAIGEQYLPDAAGAAAARQPRRGAASRSPTSSTALATAFAIGEQPTGSRDPYGLRRAAAGVVAIALGRELVARPGRARRGHDLRAARAPGRRTCARRRRRRRRRGGLVRARPCRRGAGRPRASRPTSLRAARGAEVDRPAGARRAGPRAPAAPGRVLSRGAPGARALHGASRVAQRARRRATVTRALLREPAEVELAELLVAVRPRIAEAAAATDFATGLRAAAELAPAIDALLRRRARDGRRSGVRANRLRLLVDVTDATRPIGDLSSSQVQR